MLVSILYSLRIRTFLEVPEVLLLLSPGNHGNKLNFTVILNLLKKPQVANTPINHYCNPRTKFIAFN